MQQNAYINFVIPWGAPTSGSAEFLLYNPATKEIIAAGGAHNDGGRSGFQNDKFPRHGADHGHQSSTDGTL